ncbi:MAG: hypothetical protein K6E59_06080 [Bacilli bacterium]|nr:hypothetical protein [Bacilli bacterium]
MDVYSHVPHPRILFLLKEYFHVDGFNGLHDSISIYEHSAEEIVDFLRTPHPFCAHCNVKG